MESIKWSKTKKMFLFLKYNSYILYFKLYNKNLTDILH